MVTDVKATVEIQSNILTQILFNRCEIEVNFLTRCQSKVEHNLQSQTNSNDSDVYDVIYAVDQIMVITDRFITILNWYVTIIIPGQFQGLLHYTQSVRGRQFLHCCWSLVNNEIDHEQTNIDNT